MKIKLNLGKKLILGTGVLLVLTAIVSVLGVRNILIVDKNLHSVLKTSDKINTVQELNLSFHHLLMPPGDYLVHGDKNEVEDFDRLLAVTDHWLEQSRNIVVKNGGRKRLDEFMGGYSRVILLGYKILRLDEPVGNPYGAGVMEEMNTVAEEAIGIITGMIRVMKREMKKNQESAGAAKLQAIQLMALSGLFVLVGGIAVTLFFVRGIAVPIGELVEATQRVSRGDLTVKAKITTNDEVGELAASFNTMTVDLRKITVARDVFREEVVKREQAEEELKSANRQLAANNQQLQASEQQLRALNQQLGANNQQLHATEQQLRATNQQLVGSEEALRQSAQEWQTTFDSMTDPVSILDRSFKLVRVNRAYADAIGLHPEELAGRLCYEVMHGASEPLHNCPHKQTLAHKRPFAIEHFEPVLGKYVEVSTSPICNDRGEITGTVHLCKDITERKKAIEVLTLAKEEAEVANKAKSKFLSNMSHEIRTPLNAVIGFADLLTSTSIDKTQKEFVSTIKASGNVLLDLINNILDVSKIEAGQLSLEYVNFNLEYLVESIIAIVRPTIQRERVKIEYDFAEDVPKDFRGDPTRIRQILLNLLSNAVKFTPEGEIKVTVEQVDAAPRESIDNVHLLISIQDTGVGLPDKKQDVIFESFTQADASTTREHGGTGLGLSISKQLVEIMGGRIWVESEVGKGSTFRFTLALKKIPPIMDQDIHPLALKKIAGKKILIIDDNRLNRKSLQAYCQEEKMSVLDTLSATAEALDWLSSHPDLPDIIFCNVMMPVMDGYEFCKRVRSKEQYNTVKLVAISSESIPGKARKAEKSGFDAFVPKPIVKREIIKIIRAVLGDNRLEGQIINKHMANELTLKGIKVLSVEDHAVNQKLLEYFLNKFGCDVELAFNGEEALEKIKAKHYDIVIMDLQMPVLGGIETTKRVRKKISKDLPIIAVTAAAMKEDVEKCYKAGMNDYLSKPITSQVLKEKIIKWVM